MTNGEVLHPPAEHRVDPSDHPLNRLRAVRPELGPQCPEQSRAFLHLRHVEREPLPLTAPHPPVLKAEKGEGFAQDEIDRPSLRVINFDLECCKFLTQPPLKHPDQLGMSGVPVNENHQVVGKTRVLDVRERLARCHLFRPLQHSIDPRQIQVAE